MHTVNRGTRNARFTPPVKHLPSSIFAIIGLFETWIARFSTLLPVYIRTQLQRSGFYKVLGIFLR